MKTFNHRDKHDDDKSSCKLFFSVLALKLTMYYDVADIHYDDDDDAAENFFHQEEYESVS